MLTEKDILLLKHLRGNSRKSLAGISKETGIPVSTLFDILRKLEKTVIKRHVSMINFAKMGYSVRVNFVINVSDKKRVREFLNNSSSVNNLYSLISDFDFFAECVFKDLKEMMDFKDELNAIGVNELRENFVVEDVKKEEFVPT